MNSRRAPFSTLAARLAFQVDRKILLLEEEDYLRLDLSAHEHSGSSLWALPKPSFSSSAKQFIGTALLIYVVLFGITNAPAYSKIIQANLFSGPQETDAALSPNTEALQGQTLSEDGLFGLNLNPTPYENRLTIPSLNVNAPIVEPQLGAEALKAKDWGTLEEEIRSSLLQGIVHYPGTAKPGKQGNAFFTGHSSNFFWEFSEYNTIFALLPQIEVGSDITVFYNQTEYHYTVVSKEEVSPDNVSILKQGDEKILTLMTCTPVGTALKRLVVRAELVE